MTTFKQLQDRTEAAEKMAQGAHDRIAKAEAEAHDRIAKAEVEIERYKQIARIAEAEAEILVSQAKFDATLSQVRMKNAEAVAQTYGFERNEWWEKVFLSVLGGGRSTDAEKLVSFAAEIATKATLVRAGHIEALAQEGLVLRGEES